MTDPQPSILKVEYNRKPLLVPLLLIIVGVVMLFFGPDPIIQLIGGSLAFLGILVGFVLSMIILSFTAPLRGENQEKGSS